MAGNIGKLDHRYSYPKRWIGLGTQNLAIVVILIFASHLWIPMKTKFGALFTPKIKTDKLFVVL